MAKRRGNREGTIYKRPNGTWCAQVSLPNGKRLSKYAKTRRECQAWLRETLPRVDSGLTIESARATLGAYLDHWLETNRTGWSASTNRSYRQIVRDHITPTLGRIPLHKLRADHLQRAYSDADERGVQPATVKLIHGVLRRALNQAVEWGLLASTPTKSVRPPKVKRLQTIT